MHKAIQRPQFLFDMAEELEWLNQKAGPEVALRWDDAVTATIEHLQKWPGMGRPRKDLKPSGIRSWRVKGFARWLIFYIEQPDEIVLLTIRQSSMDFTALDMG